MAAFPFCPSVNTVIWFSLTADDGGLLVPSHIPNCEHRHLPGTSRHPCAVSPSPIRLHSPCCGHLLPSPAVWSVVPTLTCLTSLNIFASFGLGTWDHSHGHRLSHPGLYCTGASSGFMASVSYPCPDMCD